VATVTLTQLQTDTLLYMDQRPGGASAHIDTTSLTRLINQAAKEFYDLLITALGPQAYVASTTLSIVANTATYNLPATLHRLVSITLEWNARDHEIVRPLAAMSDRADFVNWPQWTQNARKGYTLRGSQTAATVVEFVPTPTSAVTARVQYIPVMTELALAGDTIQVVNGWDKLISLKAAIEGLSIKGLSKQQALLEPLYAEQLQRVQDMASEQDDAEPGKVRDVGPDADRPYPRGWYYP
jgi:hypothetical protein